MGCAFPVKLPERTLVFDTHAPSGSSAAVASHILLHRGKTSLPQLLHRLDPQQGSVLFFREHVEQAVRPLAYIADALP